MAKERLPMRKTREILRLRWAQGRSVRETAASVGASTGVVDKAVGRARKAGLDWDAVCALGDDELERKLYGVPTRPGAERPKPDPVYVHAELRRPGVTLELLHLEYLEEHPDGYQYTSFCEVYRRWLAKKPVHMRQTHRAGEKVFVDYSGKTARIVDPTTGVVHEVELFVAVHGASNYSYVEATRTQRLEDWLGSHVRAVQFFGGVAEMYVPDQLKSAVSESCRYEPGITRSYAEWARHYGTAVVPARPAKPQDKGKVEVGVQIAQRWILARLRNETFFSLEALNARIRELVVLLNARPMRTYGGVTRRELFERLDQPQLRPLPQDQFEISEWLECRVNRDYHVAVFKHHYSVPHSLVTEHLEVRVTRTTVEMFFRGRRVASHVRDDTPYKPSTDMAHMPPRHRHQADCMGSVLAWANTVGPFTVALVERIAAANAVREQGWRSARGLQRVGSKYGPERTEAACERALRCGARSYKPVERILRLGRDQHPLDDNTASAADGAGITHENVRGPGYFH